MSTSSKPKSGASKAKPKSEAGGEASPAPISSDEKVTEPAAAPKKASAKTKAKAKEETAPKAKPTKDAKEPAADEAKEGGEESAEEPAHLGANGTEKQKRTRKKLVAFLGVTFSPARFQTHLKDKLINPIAGAKLKAERDKMKELKKQVKAAEEKNIESGMDKEAAAAAAHAAFSVQIEKQAAEVAKLAADVQRISNDTPILCSVLTHYIMEEYTRFGMDQALAEDKAMLHVQHFHGPAAADLRFWPLLRKLDLVANFNPDDDKKARDARAQLNKERKAAKDAKSAKESKVGKTGKAAAGKAKKDTSDEADSEAPKKSAAPKKEAAKKEAAKKEGSKKEAAKKEAAKKEAAKKEGAKKAGTVAPKAGKTKTTFISYIDAMIKVIKTEDEYKDIRISIRAKEFLSDLIIALIQHLGTLTQLVATRILGARTLSGQNVIDTVGLLLVNEGASVDEIFGDKDGKTATGALSFCKDLAEKLKTCHDNQLEAKKAKREQLTDEEREELEKKEAKIASERKSKAAKAAIVAVKKAEQRAAELAAALEAEAADEPAADEPAADEPAADEPAADGAA